MTRTAIVRPTARGWSALSKQPIAAPEETEAILKRIVDGCATYVAAFDEAGVLLCVSGSWRAFAQENGFISAGDAYGLYVLQTCRGTFDSRAIKEVSFCESVQRLVSGKQVEFQEEFICKTLTAPRWFMTRAAKVEMPDGFRILVTLEDVTRRRQAEEELRNIGGRLISAQEEERTRLARELHDDVSQRLALLSFEIDQMRPQILTSQDGLRNAVERLSQATQELSADIHRLSYRLHPFKLDQLGLSASIESMCVELSTHQDLAIEFRQQGFPAVLPDEVTLCVFRVAQESLHNVLKHSGAKAAQVIVTKTVNAVRLRVSDNGKGFDIEQAKRKKRLGLVSIKERLRLVDGRVSIYSQPDQGTQIEVVIPLFKGDGHEPHSNRTCR